MEKFTDSGLMKEEYDRVKLHATLLNTLFRKDEGDIGDRFLTKVLSFKEIYLVYSFVQILLLGKRII